MADYYPLLARALDALPDRSPAMRNAVYERARGALIGQLRSLDPPLSESDIEVESKALAEAIGRLEESYGAPAAAPRPEPAPPPVAVPEPAKPAPQPAPEPDDALFEAEARPAPGLPPAAPADLGLPPPPRREGPPLSIAPRRPKFQDNAAEAAPDVEPEAASRPTGESETPAPEVRTAEANGRQRPRIAVVAPAGRSKGLRNAFVGGVLAVVIGLIAVAAFLLRDRPDNLQQTEAETADTQVDRSDQKFGDRVGGDPAPAERQSRAPASESRPAAPPPATDMTVAQRAALIEEDTANPSNQPPITTGRVVWRLDSVSGEQGQPLQTAVVATVDVPDAGMQLTMTIQRNLDAALPASHTVTLAFKASGADAAKRTVQEVGLLQAKDEEAARGAPVSGLPIRVRDNLFLIGLSSLKQDVDRNTELLLHRNWFDVAVKYATGQRAVITFEKGNTGTQVMQSAFDQWQ
ncbi:MULTISPECIES: histidine kinase [Methylobacterium]|uniref:Histidine kinase n=2 Tax=Methylobacterium TaxID=407 RepID=A0ABQ4SWY0_9HYPH|nr:MULTISPECIES: histidine kinase [Methylobacterium]PIU08091.1 MAG: histidine kinase [Methylobacterium sp. CG09_land_8_20_14_0_10_71_15]PIU15546.1 MAG: histidine kinase [Methylobacterium sp. CG08_land_8_20_14_0_20_71_15]GJE07667.1 hypothetical protein AOPFMNJM_2997 [Methylobacterium jeotgali]